MCAASPTSPGHRTGWREIIRPTPPLQWHSREKTRPASAKTPNLGCCERAGRTFSRFRDLTAMQGELFRACRRRPSSALPISDRAPPVWRTSEGPEGTAAAPVDNGARPQYPQTTATPSPSKFRMQFPQDTDPCTLKNRRISTIRLQYLKYTQGNCMRNCRDVVRTQYHAATRPHWYGGCQRGRRAREDSRRRAKSHISDPAQLVWRTSEGPEGPAVAPVDNGARPRCLWTAAGKPRQISHVISLGHFLRPPENVAIPTVRIQCLK